MEGTVQEYAREWIGLIINLKMFIELLIPRVEDGNNFGVQVQEEVLSLLTSVESQSMAMEDEAVKYHQGRAKLLSKACILIFN